MERLFAKISINTLNLENRFVRSATWEGLATAEGAPTPRLVEMMGDLAAGGVGLIITSHSFVHPAGRATPRQLAVDRDECVPPLREMTQEVHRRGGKIACQLAHAGRFADTGTSGHPPWSVSDDGGGGRVMTHEDLDILCRSFAAAAARAKEARFDAVQIHSAHGYLLSQFLSPLFNRRKDEYGGGIENRARIHQEIIAAVRSAVGEDFPILVKINGGDHIEGGLTMEEAAAAARMMEEAGVDAVEVSGGLITGGRLSPSRTRIDSPEKEAYFRKEAKAIKEVLRIPVILVGGIRSPLVAADVLAAGEADLISMSRPFIREPRLVERWRKGDATPARCVSDNLCFRPALEGKGVFCVTALREGSV